MAEDNPKKRAAVYAPGELQKTRENLGQLDPDEAKRIAGLLGGDIGIERPINTEEKQQMHQHIQKNVRLIKNAPGNASKGTKKTTSPQKGQEPRKSAVSATPGGFTDVSRSSMIPQLPSMQKKDLLLLSKIMMDKEYRIIPNYGFFSFLFAGKPDEKINPSFIEHILTDHIGHIQRFVTASQKLLAYGSETFLDRVQNSQEFKYRVFRVVRQWDIRVQGTLLEQLQSESKDVTVSKMLPFIHELFKPLIKLYFLGAHQIRDIYKAVYTELAINQKESSREPILALIKDAIAEWYYIYGQVYKGLYPLLMRMSCTDFIEYELFYTKRISRILTFLSLTKYDLIMAQPEQKAETILSSTEEVSASEEKPDTKQELSEEVPEKKESESVIPEKVKKGLALLEKLFPEAGWDILDQGPDMYPYFEPLLKFDPGFVLLAPNNPLQLTVILMRIIEELFYGCRAITFNTADESGVTRKEDDITKIFNDWPSYRENDFEKLYAEVLQEYVNQDFAQADFRRSPYARKMMSQIMWTAKSIFLPHLSYEILTLERHAAKQEKPLHVRVKNLQKILNHLTRNIEASLKQNGGRPGLPVDGISEPWNTYSFAVQNPISYRLDAILGLKSSRNKSNANLIYQTLLIVNVLEWWINNPASYAYTTPAEYPYRTDRGGTPVFSVSSRKDINELFNRKLRTLKAIATTEQSSQKTSEDENPQ
ncbi:MAG: hypothetical protein LBU99_05995 [Spirochaetaceae bacterium]|jgi:hypothetical protein|nr:hypothetical protein [Spirochaetaceae bacterium]